MKFKTQWVLLVAVLAVGVAAGAFAGWFGRRSLTNTARTKIKNSLKNQIFEELSTIYFENVVPIRLDEADSLAARLAEEQAEEGAAGRR